MLKGHITFAITKGKVLYTLAVLLHMDGKVRPPVPNNLSIKKLVFPSKTIAFPLPSDT